MTSPSNPASLVGRKLAHYLILDVLGRGGMGTVLRAEDTYLDRIVALKVIHPALATSDDFRLRFMREQRALAQVLHPHIVVIYSTGVAQSLFYFAMEYVEGEPLSDLIRQHGAVPWQEALHVMDQTLDGMAFAHKRAIVHRDLKPNNLMVTPDGSIKIMDFGLSKLQTKQDDGLTRTGSVAGTLRYMAPEQIQGLDAVDQRSDVFSLGLTFYEMLAGRLPFDTSSSDFDIMRSIVEASFPPVTEFAPDVPDNVAAALSRALAQSPDDRYPNAEAMFGAFAPFFDDERPLSTTPSALTPAPSASPSASPVDPAPPPPTEATVMMDRTAPTGFFNATIFQEQSFALNNTTRPQYERIEESIKFYRTSLGEEYSNLLHQAKVTYYLWLACVGLGFAVLIAGVAAMLLGYLQEGALTAGSTAIIYFVQRIFQQREDHYRDLAEAKRKFLEYGNHWLLVLQSIDNIIDNEERKRRQARLVEVMIEKMRVASS